MPEEVRYWSTLTEYDPETGRRVARSAEHMCASLCYIGIHVFLWRSLMKTNHVFRLVNPVYDLNTYICVLKPGSV